MRPLTGPTEEIEAAQHRTPAPRSRLHRRAGCRQTPLLLGCGRAPSSGITHFEQLRGRTWVYNDARSLSGWHCALERLRTMRSESEFFSSTVPRAHITNPFDWSMKGSSTPPPFDSTVLAIERHLRPSPAGRFRIIESWGPWPVQPVVVRASLEEAAKAAIIEALAELHRTRAMDAMIGIPFERFASVTYEDYTAAPAVVEAARIHGGRRAPLSPGRRAAESYTIQSARKLEPTGVSS